MTLLICGVMIVCSQVSLMSGSWDWTFWPWNRSWFMFSWTDGYFYRLDLAGHLEDCTDVDLDLSRWFRYPVGAGSYRYNEIGRDDRALGELILYVCRRYNEEAAPGSRLVRVNLGESIWPQERGRRPGYDDVHPSRRQYRFHVTDAHCP